MNATNKIENRGRAYAFARELAEHLEGWGAEQAQDERDLPTLAYLQHEEGARVVIREGFDQKGRWSFFPTWPKSVNGGYCSARDWGAIAYGESEPHMTSAQGRSASSIAGQFRRAFEPAVLEIHAKVVAARDASIAWHQSREERARELATVSGGELRRQPGGGSDPIVWVHDPKRSAGSVTFHPGGSDESVRIEGYLTQREALDLGAHDRAPGARGRALRDVPGPPDLRGRRRALRRLLGGGCAHRCRDRRRSLRTGRG